MGQLPGRCLTQSVSDTKVNLQGNHRVTEVTNKFVQWQGGRISIVGILHMGCIAPRWLPQGTNLASSGA